MSVSSTNANRAIFFSSGHALSGGRAARPPAHLRVVHRMIAETMSRTRRRALSGLAVVVLLAALGYGGYWWRVGRWQVSTSDAYVGGNLVRLC